MIPLNCICLETAMVFGGISRLFEVAGTGWTSQQQFCRFDCSETLLLLLIKLPSLFS